MNSSDLHSHAALCIEPCSLNLVDHALQAALFVVTALWRGPVPKTGREAS